MTKRNARGLLGASAGAMIAAMPATPALAQDAPQANEPRGLEIVVTAQKREQQLVDVPISIAALGE